MEKKIPFLHNFNCSFCEDTKNISTICLKFSSGIILQIIWVALKFRCESVQDFPHSHHTNRMCVNWRAKGCAQTANTTWSRVFAWLRWFNGTNTHRQTELLSRTNVVEDALKMLIRQPWMQIFLASHQLALTLKIKVFFHFRRKYSQLNWPVNRCDDTRELFCFVSPCAWRWIFLI